MADQASAVPFDEAPVTMRYWLSIILFAVTGVVDFFDFFVVGFLVSVLAPKWHLTFGQTSIMLMSAGIGAMLGALASGFLADRFGRKPLAVAGVLICGLSSGAIALIPEDGWIFFAILRFFVGFGLAAGAAAAVPAIVEFAPTRHRTLVTSLVVVPVAFGVLSASITASYLLPVVGWRGLAAVGFLPIILAILTAFVMPESPRWLISKGRVREAQTSIRKLYQVGDQPFALPALPAASSARFADLFAEQRRFWLTVLIWFGASTANYGVFLWGPTIVALLLGVAPQDAATASAVMPAFVFLAGAGLLIGLAFTFLGVEPHGRPVS